MALSGLLQRCRRYTWENTHLHKIEYSLFTNISKNCFCVVAIFVDLEALLSEKLTEALTLLFKDSDSENFGSDAVMNLYEVRCIVSEMFCINV